MNVTFLGRPQTKLSILVACFTSMLMSLFLLLVLGGSKADALTLNPYPANMPADGINYLSACDTYGSSPAFFQWMGLRGSPGQSTIEVARGTQTVDLEYDLGGAVCYSNSAVVSTSVSITGASASHGTVTGAVGGGTEIFFIPRGRVGLYDGNHIYFTFDNGTPINSTVNITVTLTTSLRNTFYNGSVGCVGPCASDLSFTITLHVSQHPPTGNFDGADCNNWVGWAYDQDWPSGSIPVRAYIDGPAGTGTMLSNYTTNLYRGDVNASLGIVGDHGFSMPTPAAYKYSNHTVYMYAIGADSSGTLDDFNAFLGSISYVGCSATPGPQVSCLIDGGPAGSGSNITVTRGDNFWPNAVVTHAGPSGAPNVNPLNIDFSVGTTALTRYTGYINNGTTHRFWQGPYTASLGGSFDIVAHITGAGVDTECRGKLTVTLPNVTIQGTLYNAYNRGVRYAGINLRTCVPGVTATSDGSGNFSFLVPQGTGFCVEPTNMPPGAYTYNIRPWTVGYDTCVGYGDAVASPDYCATYTSYQWQKAGAPGTVDEWLRYDRHGDGTYDYGYDFVFRFPPQVSCSTSTNSPIEAGVPNNLTITMNATDTGGSVYPPITSGTANYDVVGVGAASGVFGVLNPRGTDVNVTPAPATRTVNAANVYTINSSVTATGDGISSGAVSCGGTATVTAGDYPYLKVYGADIRAGGGFGSGTCNTSTGGVYGFGYRPGVPASSTDFRGTSSQFGVMSLMNVNGVYSAAQRTSAPTVPRGLTFSSTGGDPIYGGNFDGNPSGGGICIPDYFNNTRAATVTGVGTVNAAIAASPVGKSQYSASSLGGSGDLTIPLQHQVAVYIDGNIVIDRNISLATGAGQTSDMPFFALIVRGNIYIAPNVSRLDGLYIAQPNTGQQATQGRIYTCSNGTTPYIATNIASACDDNPLVVNGALVAQQVKFLRTINSLRNTISTGEAPNFADGTGTNAAEVINYTPEMYIAPSPLLDPLSSAGGTGLNKYDAIYSLPPVY